MCILLVAACASPLRAQIVNPLRGFDEAERGWAGGVESTIAIADGNTEYFEFELSGAVQHQSERNRWRLLGRYQRRTASGVEIAESRMTHLRHNYRLLPWFSSLAFLQAQYEPFKRIETRLLAGAGARVDLFEGVMWHTAVGAAVMLENEELIDVAGRTTTDVRCSFFVSMFRDVKEGVDIDLVGFYQPRVDRPSDSRAVMVGSFRVDIVGDLYLVFRYNAEYDANPPAGVDNLDQNLRAGLGYDF
jgi:hypothetical protein